MIEKKSYQIAKFLDRYQLIPQSDILLDINHATQAFVVFQDT